MPVGQLDIGGEQNATGTSPLPVGTWSHLATTWDGSTLRLYVNGAQVAARTVAGPLATSTRPLSIGGNGIWGEYFAGAIDELRLYDHALTAAEIQADMNRPVGGAAPADTTPPSAPGQPVATVNGADVALSWPAATDAGGIARYHVHRSTSTGFTPTSANEIGTPASAAYTDAALAPGTYFYVVRAEDAAGNLGPPSPQTQATIPPPAPPPPGNGLVAAYGFDENGGASAADASGHGNKGTLEGATWAAGKFGSALSFNGSSSRVTIPDSASLDLTRGSTLEAWVKPSNASGWGTALFKERTGGMLYSLYASNAATGRSGSSGWAANAAHRAAGQCRSTRGRTSQRHGTARCFACT